MRGRTLTVAGATLAVVGLVLLMLPSVVALGYYPGPVACYVYVTNQSSQPIVGAMVTFELRDASGNVVYSGSGLTVSPDGHYEVPVGPPASYYPNSTLKIWATYQGSTSNYAQTDYIGITRTVTLVIPIYIPSYTVSTSVSPSGSGTVGGGGSYSQGATVTLTAVPSSGYTFSSWSGYVSGTTNPVSFTMPSQNVSVTANFTPTTTPPTKATISVDTSPVKGAVIVNSSSWGTAPQSRQVDPGTYTVDFGEVSGYTKPSSQTRTLAAGDPWNVTGVYTAQVGSFSLSLANSSAQVVQGETKELTTVTALAAGTWTQSILLSSTVSSGAGFSLSFGTNPISVGSSSSIFGNFTNASVGAWTCTINGSSGGVEVTQTFTVTVSPRGPTYKTVSGVVESLDGTKLGNVEVRAVAYRGSETETTTSSSGYYSLSLVKDNTYTLYFEVSGYETETFGPFTLTEDRTVNVTMKPIFRVGAFASQVIGLISLFSGLGMAVGGAVKKEW